MAAPPEITVSNMSGKWTMNKKLSDDQSNFLALQGIGWITRKAITMASVTLVIKQYDVDGVVHIDVTSTASGLSSTQEDRTLDWEERAHKDQVFGNVKGRSRYFKAGDFQMAIEGTDSDKQWLLAERFRNNESSPFLEEDHMQSVAFSQDGPWSVDQIWGFETVDGVRRYTRRLVCKSKGKTEILRLVYDWNGPLDG